jgi:hypothetical protein
VHHRVEIVVPARVTGGVVAELEALEGVVHLFVVYGGSVKPPGDVVTVQVLNREVDAVLVVAARARGSGLVSVSTAEVESILDEHAARAIDDDVDEAPSIPWNRGDLGCSDVEGVADLVESAYRVGRLGPARVSWLRGRRGSGVKGTPVGVSRAARCEAPLRPEGRPRILRGLHKISGGAAASVVFRCVQRARLPIMRPAGESGRARSRSG